MKEKKIIVVEDDKLLLTVFSMFIQELGHELLGAYTDAASAIEKCGVERPDVVLMDINLPGEIDGISAAEKIFYEFDIPIIYVSSYTDETTVSRAIKSSTYGYLVKPIDKVTLGITIDLVYSKHKSEHSSRLNENLVEHIYDAVFTISLNGKITFCNKGAERIFGLKKAEINELHFSSLFLENDPEFIQQEVLEKTLDLEKNEIDLSFVNSEGKRKYVFLTLSLLNDEIDEVFGIVCYCKDVTLRIKAQEEAKNYIANLKAIFNGATEAIYLVDKEYALIESNSLANQYQTRLFKKTIKPGDSIFEILNFLNQEDLKNVFKTVLDGVSHFLERSAIINGELKYFKVTIYPVIYDEKSSIDRFCVSLVNISENKRLEKDLEETRNELKPLFDSSIQKFYLSDLNFKIVTFNKSAKDVIMKEFNRTIKRGDSVLDFVPQEERQKHFIQKFEEAKRGHSIVFKEKVLIRDNEIWNETHLDPVMNERGEIYRILIWTIDITEREKNLNDLRETQERYALVAKGGNDGIWDWDIIANTVYLSPRWKSLLGYEDYELKNEFGIRDGFIHPEDFERSQKCLDDYIKERIPNYENEFRLKHKNGQYLWVLERGVLLKDDDGKPIRLAGSITDITRLKKIESETRSTYNVLLEERNMFMQGSVVIARVKAGDTSKVGYISENVSNVLGYSVEDFLNGVVTYDSLIYPDDMEHHLKERNDALIRNAIHIEYSPYRMIRKNGTHLWVKDFASIVRDEKNQITDILGYFIDITEQKNTEKILEESQKKYFSLFKNASDAIIIIDSNKVFDCNEKAETLFGYTREELLGMAMVKLSPELQPSGTPTIEKRQRKIDEAYKGVKGTFYWQYQKKDGTTFDSEISLTMLEIQDKQYLHASIRDISDRKRIERSLKESEQKYKALLEAIPDLLFIIDKQGVYTYFKSDISQDHKVPVDEVVGKTLDYFFKGEMLEKVQSCIKKALETLHIQVVEYELNSPKGMRSFEGRISPIDKDHVLMLVRDKEQNATFDHS